MISTLPAIILESTNVLTSYFTLIITLLLLGLLIQKEVISVEQESHWQNLSRALNILIIPLGLAFLAISAIELNQVFFGK